jgi:hypothetical protein
MYGYAVLRGDAGDHLVGVHVRAGARAGLEHVDRELLVVVAVGDPACRRDNGVGLLRREQRDPVHLGARTFSNPSA